MADSLKSQESKDTSDSLVHDLGAAAQDSIEYAMSRLSLAAVEAKVAIVSIMIMLMLALLGVVLVFAIWALGCYALTHWLFSAQLVSTVGAIAVVIGVNFLALIILMLCIFRLAGALRFKHTFAAAQPLEGRNPELVS